MIVIEFRKAGTTGEYYSGITHNCSDNGFIFESETLDLQSGTVLDLKLKHPDRDEIINCSGDVEWTKKQRYGFIAEVKLHSVPAEKQNILHEIILLPDLPADSATQKELNPVQSPSAEDRDPDKQEGYTNRITESIVSAFWKYSAEESGSTEERDIAEDFPHEVRTEKSGSESRARNRQGKLSPVLITVLIVSASAVLAGYLLYNSGTEKLKERMSSLLMSRNTVSDSLPKDRQDELPLKEIEEPANSQIGEAPVVTETENTFLDTVQIASDGYAPSTSSLENPEKSETNMAIIEEKTDPAPDFNQGATNLSPDENSHSESLNIGTESRESVAGKRFIIHVSAWKTKEYALSINKEVLKLYPNAIMVFENNYHVVKIPDIASHEKALSISKELADRFDLSPLIYVQRNILPTPL